MTKFNTRQIVENSPAIKASTVAYTSNFILGVGGVLNIYDNLTADDCDLINKTKILRQIQLSNGVLNHETFHLINAKLLSDRPNVKLNIHAADNEQLNTLDFFRYLPNLKSLIILLMSDEQLKKINEFLLLDELGIGAPGISLRPIERQSSLKRLFIYEKPKDIQIAGKMDWLESLTFSGQNLRNLDFLVSLSGLKELHFILGKIGNLSALPRIGKIEKLSFMLVRQLMMEDVFPINEMAYLKELSFDSQPNITDLDWLKDKRIKTNVVSCKNFSRSPKR